MDEKIQLLANVVESSDDAIITKSIDGCITSWNKGAKHLYGYSIEEVIGKNISILAPPQLKDEVNQFIKKIKEGKKVFHYETVRIRKDSKQVDVLISLSPIFDKSENLVGISTIARDITKQKKYELALIESEKKLKEREYNLHLIMDSAAEGIFGIDLEGICTFCNISAVNLLGYNDPEELIGNNIHDLIHQYKTPILGFKTGTQIHMDDEEFMREDGTIFNAEYWSCPQYKEQEIIGAAVTFMNITERKKAEIGLKKELEVNKSLSKIYNPLITPCTPIEVISNVILDEAKILTGSEHGVVSFIDPITHDSVSHSLTKMMDQCRVEKRDIHFPIGADGKYSHLWGHSLNTSLPFFTNTPSEHESSHGTPQGHILLKNFLSVPVILENEVVGQINTANKCEDYTTEDLEAIQRLGEFYALAIQKIIAEEQMENSLKEKKALLREINHRVKNNLQIIASLLHLQEVGVDQKELQDILKESESRVKTMAAVHEKLYQSPNFTDINFKQYIEKLLYDILYTYGIKSGTIQVQMDIEDINLNIDTAVPLGLIINELVTNTIKYAFPQNKGTITIKLKSLAEKMEIIIADDGIGLPKDINLENPETLGLQLVQSLVKQLDGNLKLNNDNGTEFKIIFKELKYKKRL